MIIDIHLQNLANSFSWMAVLKVGVPIVISLISLGVAIWSKRTATAITKKQRRPFFKIINKGDVDAKGVIKWYGDVEIRVQNIGLNSASNIITELTIYRSKGFGDYSVYKNFKYESANPLASREVLFCDFFDGKGSSLDIKLVNFMQITVHYKDHYLGTPWLQRLYYKVNLDSLSDITILEKEMIMKVSQNQ